MSARQIGSELRMLAAGLLLGRLVLRKPSAPEPVVVRITEPAPASKPKRKRDFFTSNALGIAVISAVVSGAISFAVAHYQSQDAASQARSAQTIASLTQLESAATNYDQAVKAYYNALLGCVDIPNSACENARQGYDTALNTLRSAYVNISDSVVNDDAAALDADGTGTVQNAGGSRGKKYLAELPYDYYSLLQDCGRLIQDQN